MARCLAGGRLQSAGASADRHICMHELIVFPDDVHDSLLHGRWIYTFDRMGAFLKRFIGGGPVITT